MLNRTISRLKQNGFRWFIWRLRFELRSPSTPFTQKILDRFLGASKIFSSIWKKTTKENILYAIYDLDVCSISFNVLEFLIDAEYESNKKNKDGFVVVIVPPSNDPNLIDKEYDLVFDATSRQWRFQNLLVPLIHLSQKCKGIYLLPQRSDARDFVRGREVYPELYDGVNLRAIDVIAFYRKLDSPKTFKGLRAPEQGLRYIRKWSAKNNIKNPIVTITIRDHAYDTPRNSNIEEWSKFADYLILNGYHPVVIPETDNAFGENYFSNGITEFKECAWNVGLRISLYETAFLNFFVPNGPLALAMFNHRCSYIAMNYLPEGSIVTTAEIFKQMNHPIGSSYRFATSNQKLCFKPDTFENIKLEFKKFLEEKNTQLADETSSNLSNQQVLG